MGLYRKAAVVGAACGFGAALILVGVSVRGAHPPGAPAVVFARDLARGQRVAPGDLRVVQVHPLRTGRTFSRIEDVQGRRLNCPALARELVAPGCLAPDP